MESKVGGGGTEGHMHPISEEEPSQWSTQAATDLKKGPITSMTRERIRESDQTIRSGCSGLENEWL